MRIPGPVGCLALLVTLPLAALAFLVSAIASRLLGGVRTAPAGSLPTDGATALLVTKMALDDDFDRADAEMAGVPLDGGASVEALLLRALELRWMERKGARYGVTSRGRAQAPEVARRAGF